MIRALLILTLSFAVGFALCLVVRAGLHRPYAGAGTAASAMDMASPMTMAPASAEHGGAVGPAGPAASPAHLHGAPAASAAAPAASAPPAAPAPAPAAVPAGAAGTSPAHPSSSGVELGLPRLGVETGRANSVCPVCGAEVDPTLPTSLYHGRIIGFGCRPNRCKERFDADPERYGPAALANRKAE